MTTGRIIGLGQSLAGDDGVGLAVLDWLRGRKLSDVELCDACDPTALVTLLACACPVVIVDALVGTTPGRVRALAPASLDAAATFGASSHGFGVGEAIGLAQALAGERFTPSLHLVGVTIAQATPGRIALSAEVAAAVPYAARLALRLAR